MDSGRKDSAEWEDSEKWEESGHENVFREGGTEGHVLVTS